MAKAWLNYHKMGGIPIRYIISGIAGSLVDSSNTLDFYGSTVLRKKYTYDNSSYLTGVSWYNNINKLVLTESFTVTNGNITQHTYNAIDTTNAALPRGS